MPGERQTGPDAETGMLLSASELERSRLEAHVAYLEDMRRRWELKQGPTCHRCGNSWAARDQAERRVESIRAETVAEIVAWLRNEGEPTPPEWLRAALAIEREFSGSAVPADEKGRDTNNAPKKKGNR